MHARTLLLLLLLVAGLGGFAWWQTRREARDVRDADRPLLEGFDRTTVASLRVDNLERSLQLRLDVQPDGTFQITDPVDFPAEPAVIEMLFDLLAHQRATTVVGGEPRKLALDPPRVVLEIDERSGVSSRTRRIELGAVDIDQQHAFARVDGVIVRTERGLDAALERELPEWREKRVLRMAATSVVEFHRRGRYQHAEEPAPLDLTLDAIIDGPWRATAPFNAQLQPNAVALFLSAVAWLRVDAFIDVPGGVEHYGLDRPTIEIELVDLSGGRETLRLTQEPGREQWFAMRSGAPYVFRVAGEAVAALSVPSAQLIDRKLIDVVRERIDSIELVADARRVTLTRVGSAWRLSAREGERVTIDSEPADANRALDLLGQLEQVRFASFLFERTLDEPQAVAAIRIHAAGEVQGGILGTPFRTSDGADGVPFRRDGDALVVALDPKVLELARTDPSSLRSLELHKVSELDVARIELASTGVQRTYNRNANGQWSRQGSELEAKDFAKLVDRLLSMRANEVLQRAFDDRIEALVEVKIVTAAGGEIAFTLGQRVDAGAGEPIAVYRNATRLARVKPELHAELRALLAGD